MKAIFCVTVVSILLLNTCAAAFGQSQKEVLSRVLSLNILYLPKLSDPSLPMLPHSGQSSQLAF